MDAHSQWSREVAAFVDGQPLGNTGRCDPLKVHSNFAGGSPEVQKTLS